MQFEDEEAQEPSPEVQSTSGRKRLFSKELRCMMYGFGDDQNPYTESVDLLEDLVLEFITQMVNHGFGSFHLKRHSDLFLLTLIFLGFTQNKESKSILPCMRERGYRGKKE